MKAKRSFEFLYQFLLGAVDFGSVYLGYAMAFFVYAKFIWLPPQPWSEIRLLALIPAALCVISFTAISVYRCPPGPMELDRLRRILSAYFWSEMSTFSLTFFAKSYGYSRLMVLFGFFFGILNLLIGRAILAALMKPLRKNLALRKTLILGSGRVGKTLARNLINSRLGEY